MSMASTTTTTIVTASRKGTNDQVSQAPALMNGSGYRNVQPVPKRPIRVDISTSTTASTVAP